MHHKPNAAEMSQWVLGVGGVIHRSQSQLSVLDSESPAAPSLLLSLLIYSFLHVKVFLFPSHSDRI